MPFVTRNAFLLCAVQMVALYCTLSPASSDMFNIDKSVLKTAGNYKIKVFPAYCNLSCIEEIRRDRLLIPAGIVAKDNRERLNSTEMLRYNGVGQFYSKKEGYHYRRSMMVRPTTGTVTRFRDMVVTTAHTFYNNGKLKASIDEMVFALGNFESGDVEEFEIADIEVGTANPQLEPEKDFAVIRLREKVPDAINPMTFKYNPDEVVIPTPRKLILVGFHYDFYQGLVPAKSEGRLREKLSDDPWYFNENIVIFDHDSQGRSSGAPLISFAGEWSDYIEVINIGYVMESNGNNFDPYYNFNYGVKIARNQDFYDAFLAVYNRGQ